MQFAFLFALALSISPLSVLSQPECPFIDCTCSGTDDSYMIICLGNNSAPLPTRIYNASRTNLTQLLFLEYKQISEWPSDYLTNLTIKTLSFFRVNLRNIESKLFSGVDGIEELDLLEINLESISTDAFSRIGQTLKKLDLTGNGLNDVKFASFKPAYSYLTKLDKLYLTNNSIQSLSADSISAFNTSLTQLFLAQNSIDDDSLNKMQPALDSLGNLEFLGLSSNKITNLNGNLFKNIKNLNSLFLNSNQIRKMENSLFANNLNLSTIDLGFNQISNLTRSRQQAR
jgi:hypothetical protein